MLLKEDEDSEMEDDAMSSEDDSDTEEEESSDEDTETSDDDATEEDDVESDEDSNVEDDSETVDDEEVEDDSEETEDEEDSETLEESDSDDGQAAEVSGDGVVVLVEETELVSLVPQAQDPDADQLQFTFTTPLDENGEWQTTYGDAGEYTVTVTASDGTLTANQDVLVIVRKKEEAPTFDITRPIESAADLDETETLLFSVEATDLNDDDLEYSWKLDGVEVGYGRRI